MPFIASRLRSAAASHPVRRAAPRCRGGASSLLRLVQPLSRSLPHALDVNGWAGRAAAALASRTAPPFAPSEFSAV